MADEHTPGRRLRESWQANARAWIEAVRTGAIASRRLGTDDAIVAAALRQRPRRVLDLGCGEGWLARALAPHDIAVVGIDGSADLIAAAVASGSGTFLHLGYDGVIAEPGRCGHNFDLVVANFALFDEKPQPLLASVRTIMTAEARLLIQTLHPDNASPPGRDGWRVEEFQDFAGAWTPVPWYFRTAESWAVALKEGGFAVRDMTAPPHPEDGRPLSLLIEAVLA